MTQEEKQLLLKDLCGRLPYGVKVRYATTTVDGIEVVNIAALKMINIYYGETILSCYEGHEVRDIEMDGDVFKNIMPLIRPMSSMTDEEKMKYLTLTHYNTDDNGKPRRELTLEALDWLNANHFDYRGLIPRDLALPAPADMYK